MDKKQTKKFGAGVIESAEADERTYGDLRSTLARYLILALVGSGFMTCGVVELLTSK